jgi:hypothetical protein
MQNGKMVSKLAPEASADCYIAIVVFDWLFLVVPLLHLYDCLHLNRRGFLDLLSY